MTAVRLETSLGDLVVRSAIPSFQKAPDVIVWGDRHFKHLGIVGDAHVYRECFAYHLVTD